MDLFACPNETATIFPSYAMEMPIALKIQTNMFVYVIKVGHETEKINFIEKS